MIKQDTINCITLDDSEGKFYWVGLFVGIPEKGDVLAAIWLDIDEPNSEGTEQAQERVEGYELAAGMLEHALFNDVDEDVYVAGVLMGNITCERLGCFNVPQKSKRCV